MTPEKQVQNAIVEYAKQLYKEGKPIYIERRQAGGFNYRMGIPDLYVVANGKHIEIEVKAPGKLNHLSPMQEKFRDMCKKLNICWCVVDNVEDAKKVILEELR